MGPSKIGVFKNFSDRLVRSRSGPNQFFVLKTSPGAQKKPYKMDKTMVEAQIGAVRSNITKKSLGVFCFAPQKDSKVMCMFSREIDIGLYPKKNCGF